MKILSSFLRYWSSDILTDAVYVFREPVDFIERAVILQQKQVVHSTSNKTYTSVECMSSATCVLLLLLLLIVIHQDTHLLIRVYSSCHVLNSHMFRHRDVIRELFRTKDYKPNTLIKALYRPYWNH
jgi:hypothetical protein